MLLVTRGMLLLIPPMIPLDPPAPAFSSVSIFDALEALAIFALVATDSGALSIFNVLWL